MFPIKIKKIANTNGNFEKLHLFENTLGMVFSNLKIKQSRMELL